MQSGELFKVQEILSEIKPVLYKLVDLMNDEVPGFYYESQLTKAPPPNNEEFFLVEKVLKQKIVKGEKFFLIKYLFFPNKVIYINYFLLKAFYL